MELHELIGSFIEPIKTKKAYLDKLLKEIGKLQILLKEPVKNAFLVSQWIKGANAEFAEKEYYNGLKQILEIVNEKNEKNKEELAYLFSRDLKEAFEKETITIKGNYPDYSVGLYQLKVDFESGTASFFFARELLKGNIKLNIKNILAAFKQIDKELTGRSFNGKDFIRLLFEAYKRALILNDLEHGKRINIILVLKELALLLQPPAFDKDPKKENFRTYSRAFFSYDLYKLRSETIIEHEGQRLNLGTATIDYAGKDKYSLYVIDDLTGGNYIMYLSFIRNIQ